MDTDKRMMDAGQTDAKPVWVYFLLIWILSIPFWIIGPIVERLLPGEIPIDLPLSAFMFVNPTIAAAILLYRERGWDGVKALLRRTFDAGRIQNKVWYLPAVFLWPLMMVAAYGLMLLAGAPLPADPEIPIAVVPLFFVLFFIGNAFEELGWSGFAIDRLQSRRGALQAAVIIGAVWGVWHGVPLLQTDRSPAWIAWQVLGMIPFRILLVWLYNNTGGSVFATIVLHAMSNVSQFLFPNYGSHYDAFFALLVLAFTAAIVVVIWGAETLSRRRTARLSA